jgi:hypothetical protein
MDKKQLFAFFKKQAPPVLIEYLETAYEAMSTDQRIEVFGPAIQQAQPLRVNGKTLLKQVEKFQHDSLAGEYYAPFDINSKNFMHVPEETRVWFERLGDLLTESQRLSEQGDHANAVTCFRILYELVEVMSSGEEIVFADEYGTWMIPIDERKAIVAYLTSLAATSTPEDYAAAVLPLIRRDACESFSKKTYSAAIRVADKAQKTHLKTEIQRQGIRTQPRPSQ